MHCKTIKYAFTLCMVLLITLFSACTKSSARDYAPYHFKNTKWNCQEIDAYFVVDRWQLVFGEMTYEGEYYCFNVEFLDPTDYFCFYRVSGMNKNKIDRSATNIILSGKIKYHNGYCIITIPSEYHGGRECNLTFVCEQLENMIDFDPEKTRIPYDIANTIFDTPEEAYLSVNSQFDNILHVVEGTDFSLIIAMDSKSLNYCYTMIPKESTGWKAAKSANTVQAIEVSVNKATQNKCQCFVYHYADFEEVFIQVNGPQDILSSIYDNQNNKMVFLPSTANNAEAFINLETTNQDYAIYIDGKEFHGAGTCFSFHLEN